MFKSLALSTAVIAGVEVSAIKTSYGGQQTYAPRAQSYDNNYAARTYDSQSYNAYDAPAVYDNHSHYRVNS
jgi:hypothetical protein